MLFRHPRRVWHVLSVLFRYFIAPSLRLPMSDRRPGPVRMRLALELGGAWLKLGQMLALRFDLLPAAYCDELFGLLNQVAPFPYAEVRRIVRRRARGGAGGGLPVVRTGVVRRRVDRPGPSRDPPLRRARRRQGPATGIRESLQADIELMYGMSWLLDRVHLFGVGRSRDRHRRVRALDRGRARLPGRGPSGRPPLGARRGRRWRRSRASTASTRRPAC